MPYVDSFVIPLPKKNLDAYREIARRCGEVWREHGAINYVECVADDVKPGKLTSFPQSVNLEDGEIVIASYITYESRAARDACNEKVMADPRLADLMSGKDMPFDGKRMIFGGFEVLHQA